MMRSGFLVALAAVLAVSGHATAAATTTSNQDDLITDLPGLNVTLGFKQYSGYLSLGGGYEMFYYFVESMNDPATDPLVPFFSGGPGCSSLGSAAMTELGPLRPNANGGLDVFPYAWNKVANVLFLESPVGVGFSILPNSTHFNDNRTASDNLMALEQFFLKFPQYTTNDLYLTGESYAGHYVPMLSYWIVKYGSASLQKQFKGFMVGNPSTSQRDDASLEEYYRTHGLIPFVKGEDYEYSYYNYNPYDILVDVCEAERLMRQVTWPNRFVDSLRENRHRDPSRYVPNPPPCLDDYVNTYLNRADVQKALHVVKHQSWTVCGGPPYQFGTESMVPYYEFLMDNTDLKIWVYSGDADTVVNFLDTQIWVYGLKRNVHRDWHAWKYERIDSQNGPQLGGYRVVFDRITFSTVHGSGHMVPTFQPAPALQLFESYLAAKPSH